MENWIESEFATLELDDKRLVKRALNIINAFKHAPGKTIPQAFQTWKEIKACYRFFDNPSVGKDELLKPHLNQTIQRIKNEPIVLIPSDNSTLDYTSKKSMKGKGDVYRNGTGMFLHASIAITPDRLSLGLVDANLWIRGIDYPNNKEIHRDDLLIEEKESFRWIEGYKKASELAKECCDTQIIYIADREADIVELLGEALKEQSIKNRADIIIRSQHDRQLDEKNPEGTLNRPYKKLIKTLKETPSLGEISFVIPSTADKKGRVVNQRIRAAPLTFRTKKYNGNKTSKITINVVMATEESAQLDKSQGLSWIFLTTLPINNFEEACKVIEYYLCRWEIEMFFKVLKSGCKVEERQLESTDRMKPLIALFLILSWRIMYVMRLGRSGPEMSCNEVFSDSEWKSVFRIHNRNATIPQKPPSLNEFILMVAQLGGYIIRKKEPPPGIKVMWKGMARMADFALAWEAFGNCG